MIVITHEQGVVIKALWSVMKRRERGRRARAKQPEKNRERARNYRAQNLHAVRAKGRAYTQKNKAKNVGRNREWLYGKGAHAHLQAQIKAQGNLCAICDEPLTKPNLDHNHKTGQKRGALCSHCNRGLGCFKELTGTLRKAIAYLRKWKR